MDVYQKSPNMSLQLLLSSEIETILFFTTHTHLPKDPFIIAISLYLPLFLVGILHHFSCLKNIFEIRVRKKYFIFKIHSQKCLARAILVGSGCLEVSVWDRFLLPVVWDFVSKSMVSCPAPLRSIIYKKYKSWTKNQIYAPRWKNWPHQKNRANSISNPSNPEGVKFSCVYTSERTNAFRIQK